MTAPFPGLLEGRQLSGTCVRVRGVDFASVSTGLSIIFWNYSDSVVFFFGFWNCSDSVVFFLIRFWNCSDSVVFFLIRFWNYSDSVVFF
jgi:hypothetical protein